VNREFFFYKLKLKNVPLRLKAQKESLNCIFLSFLLILMNLCAGSGDAGNVAGGVQSGPNCFHRDHIVDLGNAVFFERHN